MLILSYAVTAISIIGTIANSFQKRWCFYVWIITNSFWVVFNTINKQHSQAILYLFNLAMAIVGLRKWRKTKVKKLEYLEKYRIHDPVMQSMMDNDFIGAYTINLNGSILNFLVLVSIHDGEWEHVSVSTEYRCPRWEEMSQIKDLFFEEEEAVIQLHPPKSNYINNHPYCLHLWRPLKVDIPMPNINMV